MFCFLKKLKLRILEVFTSFFDYFPLKFTTWRMNRRHLALEGGIKLIFREVQANIYGILQQFLLSIVTSSHIDNCEFPPNSPFPLVTHHSHHSSFSSLTCHSHHSSLVTSCSYNCFIYLHWNQVVFSVASSLVAFCLVCLVASFFKLCGIALLSRDAFKFNTQSL